MNLFIVRVIKRLVMLVFAFFVVSCGDAASDSAAGRSATWDSEAQWDNATWN